MWRFGECNLNPLMNKFDPVCELINSAGLCVLVVAETWLISGIFSFIDLPDFSVVGGGDTDGDTHKHGVCIYIRKEIRFMEVSLEYSNVAAVHLVDVNIHVLAVYRPLSYSEQQNNQMTCIIATCFLFAWGGHCDGGF